MKKLLLSLLAISMMAFVGCTTASNDSAPADDTTDVVEPAADDATADAALGIDSTTDADADDAVEEKAK